MAIFLRFTIHIYCAFNRRTKENKYMGSHFVSILLRLFSYCGLNYMKCEYKHRDLSFIEFWQLQNFGLRRIVVLYSKHLLALISLNFLSLFGYDFLSHIKHC